MTIEDMFGDLKSDKREGYGSGRAAVRFLSGYRPEI